MPSNEKPGLSGPGFFVHEAGMTDEPISLITVTHGLDLPMLRLQARGLRLYADRDLVDDITIILNDPNPAALRAQFDHNVRADYGPLSNKLRILDWQTLWHGRLGKSRIGWRSQQVLKLLGAAKASAPYALILDTKTFPVRALNRAALFDAEGKLRTHLEPFVEKFYQHFLSAADIVGLKGPALEDGLAIGDVLPSAPPVLTLKSTVQTAIQALERKSGTPFAQAFMANPKLTEFYLYAAQAIADGSIHHYKIGQPRVAGLFAGTLTRAYIEDQYERLNRPDVWAFNLHRQFVERCTDTDRAVLEGRLRDFGLLTASEQIVDFFPKTPKSAAIRKIWTKARKALRAARGRG